MALSKLVNFCRPLRSTQASSFISKGKPSLKLRYFSSEDDFESNLLPDDFEEPEDDWVSKIKPGYSPHVPPKCDAWDLTCHSWEGNDRENTLVS